MIDPLVRATLLDALASAADPELDVPTTFVIADGAAIPELTEKLCEWEPPYACLYSGDLEPDLARAAPYIVETRAGAPFLTWFLDEGWGSNAFGFLARSHAPLRDVRRHLRTLTYARMPDGSVSYFRFYDPRVLADLLPTCDAAQRVAFFGPMSDIYLDGPGGAILRADRSDRSVSRIPIVRSPAAPAGA